MPPSGSQISAKISEIAAIALINFHPSSFIFGKKY
jgi:hypothetical protein